MYKQRHEPPNEKRTIIKNYKHIGYIGCRPGVMKESGYNNGLFGYVDYGFKKNFNNYDDAISKVSNISKEKKTMFRSIISFSEQQAQGLGLCLSASALIPLITSEKKGFVISGTTAAIVFCVIFAISFEIELGEKLYSSITA